MNNPHSRAMVSILIPAYNAQDWIADTLRSALAQTWEAKEIIVVDDGSTDHTLAIARRFESAGVRVFTQKNQGAAVARNAAFAHSRGDYIQWLDADDLLAPDKIEQQLRLLGPEADQHILLSGTYGRFQYRYYRAAFIPTRLWRDHTPIEWLLCKLSGNVFMQTGTWLVSRSLTEAAGPWNTELLGDDDGEYFCRVIRQSRQIRFAPSAKLYYRAPRIGTLSYVGRSRKKLDAHWKSMQLHISHIRQMEESERVRRACLTYLQSCLIYFYPERLDILREMEATAESLGGKLESPMLSWKYSWIRAVFGWQLAKRARSLAPQLKWQLVSSWDGMLFRVRNRFFPVEP
jgi:glycosyltransferase involved in cell wall biosynthesis